MVYPSHPPGKCRRDAQFEAFAQVRAGKGDGADGLGTLRFSSRSKEAVPNPRRRVGRRSGMGGFSLVEVALAIGIVSFCMLAILGLLPVGLSTMQESASQEGTASIARQIRAQLQQISFNPTNAFNIQGLTGQTGYYTRDGIVTNAAGAYYKVSFAVGSVSVAGASSNFNTNSAQNVTVTLSYPTSAPASSQRSNVFSLLAARQSSD